MGTAGAYAGVAFSFNYSFVDSATPSSFFATDLTTADVTVYSRTGPTTGAGAAIASAPTRSGSIYTFTLSTSEMTGDEVLLECSKTGMVSETISIALEPTPADISEVQKSTVAIGDFRATGFSTFDPASDTVANVTTVGSVSGAVGSVTAAVTTDSASRTASQADVSALATSAALATAQTDLDTLTGSDGVTLATSQPNYAPNTTTPPTAAAVADAVLDEALSGHTVAGSLGKAIKQLKEGTITVEGSVNDASATTTTFVSNLTESTDGFYHDKVIVFISGALTGQARHIETYTGSTKSITVSQAFTSAPANADEFLILATHEHSINEIQSGLATASALSTVDGKIDTVDGIVDAILADTGTDGVVLSTATLQSIADEILKRDVDNVEATANEHTLATIILCLLESSRSATTWTIKRSDGTTTHATKTLTLDSAANPVVGVD